MGAVDRLVLWNIDLTLLDVGRVSRDAYADAFRRVTGKPLVSLPQVAGRSDSEIFFESLALNDVVPGDDEVAEAELLSRYCWELEAAFTFRHEQLRQAGRLTPGARAAVTAVSHLPGVVQSVLTGTIKANAAAKLQAFGLDRFFDLEIGGYGSDAYPRGSLLLMTTDQGRGEVPGRLRRRVHRLHRRHPPRRRGGQDRRRAQHRGGDRPGHRRRASGCRC